jgi:hypothetical protein
MEDKTVVASEPTSPVEKKFEAPAVTDGEHYNGVEAVQGDKTLAVLELVKAQDAHHPIHWPASKRWGIIIVYCLLQVFVTLTSTTYVSAEWLVQEIYGGSTQVVVLGQSMFIVGTAVGPAFLGPLS